MKYLYQTSFQFWSDESEIQILNEMNAEFRDISVEEEAFVNYYEANLIDIEAAQFLTTTQIHQSLVQKTGHKTLSIQALGRVLRELKVER